MVQLSIINPQNILPTFANLKLAMFYLSCFESFFQWVCSFYFKPYFTWITHTLVMQNYLIGGYWNKHQRLGGTRGLYSFTEAANQTKDLLWRACTAQPTRNSHIRSTRANFRSHVGLVSLSQTFPKNAPGTIIKWRWEVSMDVEWSTVVELDNPWYRGVKLYTISRGAEHNSESQQRYRNCRDLENFIQKTYERRRRASQRSSECYIRRRRR